MMALQGYYDGNSVQTLEKIQAKKNQKLVITILDEFIEGGGKAGEDEWELENTLTESVWY